MDLAELHRKYESLLITELEKRAANEVAELFATATPTAAPKPQQAANAPLRTKRRSETTVDRGAMVESLKQTPMTADELVNKMPFSFDAVCYRTLKAYIMSLIHTAVRKHQIKLMPDKRYYCTGTTQLIQF